MTEFSAVENSLVTAFDGWDGYNRSVIHAVEGLTPQQLAWRPRPNIRSVGEQVRHMSFGRITWFRRMDAPLSAEIVKQIEVWDTDEDGAQHANEDAFPITEDITQLIHWLNLSWTIVDATLKTWTLDDLSKTYRHKFIGNVYDVSRQWTIWRIMAHDIQHGGEISLMLGMQGIEAFELSALGGHITMPPLAK
jgi:uncharacterized damage-inducible protein DinB